MSSNTLHLNITTETSESYRIPATTIKQASRSEYNEKILWSQMINKYYDDKLHENIEHQFQKNLASVDNEMIKFRKVQELEKLKNDTEKLAVQYPLYDNNSMSAGRNGMCDAITYWNSKEIRSNLFNSNQLKNAFRQFHPLTKLNGENLDQQFG